MLRHTCTKDPKKKDPNFENYPCHIVDSDQKGELFVHFGFLVWIVGRLRGLWKPISHRLLASSP